MRTCDPVVGSIDPEALFGNIKEHGLPGIEDAYFIPSFQWPLFRVIPQGKRIYYGNEFCENLLPKWTMVRRARDLAKKNDSPFTLALPWVTDRSIDEVRHILNQLMDGDELICSDWGIYSIARAHGRKLKLIIGRLLNNTQKKDPRGVAIKNRPLESPPFLRGEMGKMLKSSGIDSVEIDDPNRIQDFSTTKFFGHLHYPFTYVATTRKCLLANSSHRKRKTIMIITSCEHECQRHIYGLDSPMMPKQIILRGNTNFVDYREVALDTKELKSKNISRIIHHCIPM